MKGAKDNARLSSSNTHCPSSHSDPGQRQSSINARSPTSSLIQSAARSILDDATPSTIVSDDESENGSCADISAVRSRDIFQSPSTLASLQTETAPAIPSEQDRRRFIGCLAAVAASAYDFEGLVELEINSTDSASVEHIFDQTGDEPLQFLRSASSISESKSTSLHAASESDSYSAGPSRTDIFKEEGTSGFDKNFSSVPRKFSSRSVNPTENTRFSKQRHRRRRYEILTRLLVTSAELLFLDRSVARAFLPMLEELLAPKIKTQQNPTRLGPRLTLDDRSVGMGLVGSFSGLSGLDDDSGNRIRKEVVTVEENLRGAPEQAPEYHPEDIDKEGILKPFIESLTPGAGFRCLSLLLLQHLLSSDAGYDARVRHVLKKVGVIILMHDMEKDPVEDEMLPPKRKHETRAYHEMVRHATRKWEALEHSIARRLIRLAESNTRADNKQKFNDRRQEEGNKSGITREQIVRGVKIGSAGLVAGTLFAVTGGLAAPGIAAGVAAFAGAAAGTAAVVTLTSTAFLTTMFGVGGGSLAAYKMQRRTQGLTEFEFQKETSASIERQRCESHIPRHQSKRGAIEAELFSTICISGWLRDEFDFQRPWGLHPSSPKLKNRLELLERFYSIHNPTMLPKCRRILESWKGEEDKLWNVLREKYGCDPDQIFPLQNGQRLRGMLTLEQEETLDQIFVELGYNSQAPNHTKHHEKHFNPWKRTDNVWYCTQHDVRVENHSPLYSSNPSRNIRYYQGSIHEPGTLSRSNVMETGGPKDGEDHDRCNAFEAPQHVETVWDYKSTYGGELYTIRWESDLIKKICDCVMDMAMDVVSGATRQILKQTILSTLLSAVVLPTYVLNVANMIDGDWTLAVERAELAGKELAKILLSSRAGCRPVTLVGFSFGARVIYCCLKELARLQKDWDNLQELLLEEKEGSCTNKLLLEKLKEKFEDMREPASIIEDAIMMGLPNHLSLQSWKACRQVVGGRLVNCFSTKDLILSLMFQAKRFSGGSLNNGVGGFFFKPVCGTCPVPEPGVENFDVSDLVSGHQDYCLVTGKILARVHHGEPLRYTAVG